MSIPENWVDDPEAMEQVERHNRSIAPKTCLYCKGHVGQANSTDDPNPCGFCNNGKPLDTQEDWDRTWGRILSIDVDPNGPNGY